MTATVGTNVQSTHDVVLGDAYQVAGTSNAPGTWRAARRNHSRGTVTLVAADGGRITVPVYDLRPEPLDGDVAPAPMCVPVYLGSRGETVVMVPFADDLSDDELAERGMVRAADLDADVVRAGYGRSMVPMFTVTEEEHQEWEAERPLPEYATSRADVDYAVIDEEWGVSLDITVKWPGVVCLWNGLCAELVNVNGVHLGYCGSCGKPMGAAELATVLDLRVRKAEREAYAEDADRMNELESILGAEVTIVVWGRPMAGTVFGRVDGAWWVSVADLGGQPVVVTDAQMAEYLSA